MDMQCAVQSVEARIMEASGIYINNNKKKRNWTVKSLQI